MNTFQALMLVLVFAISLTIASAVDRLHSIAKSTTLIEINVDAIRGHLSEIKRQNNGTN